MDLTLMPAQEMNGNRLLNEYDRATDAILEAARSGSRSQVDEAVAFAGRMRSELEDRLSRLDDTLVV